MEYASLAHASSSAAAAAAAFAPGAAAAASPFSSRPSSPGSSSAAMAGTARGSVSSAPSTQLPSRSASPAHGSSGGARHPQRRSPSAAGQPFGAPGLGMTQVSQQMRPPSGLAFADPAFGDAGFDPAFGLPQHSFAPPPPGAYAFDGSGAYAFGMPPALAHANAALSHYASTAGSGEIAPGTASAPANAAAYGGLAAAAHLSPHALSSALAEWQAASMPGSAASSPGAAAPRRAAPLASGAASGPGTGASTPAHNVPHASNSRVAASAVTGKRLNWSEMICQTIAESESGRLVIQDLFESMCNKFPEIREWAFGKDWEARVKNRIKSTLSIKGTLFIKVPRPSSAAGKGSWWTLSQEAQDAWKEGRVASVVKNSGTTHGRSASASSKLHHDGAASGATSRTASRAPSRANSRRGSPVSSRGPSSAHAQHANQHAKAAAAAAASAPAPMTPAHARSPSQAGQVGQQPAPPPPPQQQQQDALQQQQQAMHQQAMHQQAMHQQAMQQQHQQNMHMQQMMQQQQQFPMQAQQHPGPSPPLQPPPNEQHQQQLNAAAMHFASSLTPAQAAQLQALGMGGFGAPPPPPSMGPGQRGGPGPAGAPPPMFESGLEGLADGASQLSLNERRMRLMENSVNDSFGSTGGGPLPNGMQRNEDVFSFNYGQPMGNGAFDTLLPGAPSGESSTDSDSGSGALGSDVLLDAFGGADAFAGLDGGFDDGAFSLLDSPRANGGGVHGGVRSQTAPSGDGGHSHSRGGSGSGGRGTPSAGLHIPGATPLDSSGLLSSSPADSASGSWYYAGAAAAAQAAYADGAPPPGGTTAAQAQANADAAAQAAAHAAANQTSGAPPHNPVLQRGPLDALRGLLPNRAAAGSEAEST